MEPAPERHRKRTWKQFLRSHWEPLYACDFFSRNVLGVFRTVRRNATHVVHDRDRSLYGDVHRAWKPGGVTMRTDPGP